MCYLGLIKAEATSAPVCSSDVLLREGRFTVLHSCVFIPRSALTVDVIFPYLCDPRGAARKDTESAPEC